MHSHAGAWERGKLAELLFGQLLFKYGRATTINAMKLKLCLAKSISSTATSFFTVLFAMICLTLFDVCSHTHHASFHAMELKKLP